MKRSKTWLILAVFTSYPTFAVTYNADVVFGSDNNAGTVGSPFKTLAKCLTSLKAAGDVCELAGGTYDAGGVVNASGTTTNPIVIQARAGQSVTIRQGVVPTWVSSGNNLWSTSFDYTSLLAAQRANTNYYERGILLWQDSVRTLPEASFPHLPANSNGFHPTIISQIGTSPTLVVNPQIPNVDLRGARAMIYPYLGAEVEARPVISSGPGQVSITMGFNFMEVGKPFFLQGAKGLIGQDWEWAWDQATGKIWIQMPAGMDPNQAKVRVQNSSTAFTLQAASNVVIRDIHFKGVVPVASAGSVGVQYQRLTIKEPGILNFTDETYLFIQKTGLVVQDQAQVTYSVIDGCNGRCLDVYGDNVMVYNNFISNASRLGQFDGAITVEGMGAFIKQNRIENSGRDGVAFMTPAVQNSIVRRNLILNCGLQAYDAGGVIIGAHPNGAVTIDSNLIENVGHGGSGIFLDENTQQNVMSSNVIGGTRVGLMMRGDINAAVKTCNFNFFGNNTILQSTSAFAAVRDINDISATRIFDNITNAPPLVETIVANALVIRASSEAEFVGLGAYWRGNLQPGVDPLLADVANFNFTPTLGSPAIDIGVYYGRDFKGAGPDAGAVEAQTTQWVYGPYDPPAPSNPTMGFEDLSKWNPPSWDNTPYTKTLSTDRVEGTTSMAITTSGFKAIQSSALNQSDIKGLGFVKWNMKLSTLQPNPYWIGAVQILVSCPSMGVYNAWVGQIELTGLAQAQWIESVLPIPGDVASKLQGKQFSDFQLTLTVNTPQGEGPILFDNLRLLP